MSLVRRISTRAAARYGVSILESDTPSALQGVESAVIAVVGDFPWGPVNTPTYVSGPGLFEAFAPPDLIDAGDVLALRAFIGKIFPTRVLVVRAESLTGAVASAMTTTGGADSVEITARSPGIAGNSITVEWTEGSTVAHRSLVVSTAAGYSATYLDAAVEDGGVVTIVGVEDPLVAVGVPLLATLPDVAVEPLVGGASTSPTAAEYLAAVETLAAATLEWSVAIVAEPPAAEVPTINIGLELFANAHNRGMVVLNAPVDETLAEAMTDVATYTSDRVIKPWPRVEIANQYGDLLPIEADSNSFVAVATASMEPHLSPGGAGGVRHLRGIQRVTLDATADEYEAAKDAGIMVMAYEPAFRGAVIRGAVTASTESEDKRRVFRRRLTDFIGDTIAAGMARFTELPLDIDLASKSLGPTTGSQAAIITAFLEGLSGADQIREYSVDYFSGNSQATISAGQWFVIVKVAYHSMQEQIVLNIQGGTSVIVDSGA